MKAVKKVAPFLASMVLLLTLSGCTNNPTVLKLLYGQFDNVLRKEMLSYADFSEQQKIQINGAVDNTVKWHRTTALPDYVALLAEAQSRLIDSAATESDIEWLFENAQITAKEFEAKSPILALTGMIKALSDEQISEIEEKLNEELQDQLEELEERAEQDTAEESTKSFTKFMKRLGLRLNKSQREAVTSSFRTRQLSEAMQFEAWRQWTGELIELLKRRADADFESQLTAHYTSRLSLIRQTYPSMWQADHEQRKQMLLQLFGSLEQQQKEEIRERLALLSQVALELAAEE